MLLVILYTLVCLCNLYHHGDTLSLDRINVAQNKSTNQSGTTVWPSGSNNQWLSYRAVDGLKLCRNGSNEDFSSTENELDPWWQVDLGNLYTVDTIIVYGRKDNNDQLKGFRVHVSDGDTNHSVYNDTTYSNAVGKVEIVLRQPMIIRYVKIDQPGTYRDPVGRQGPLVMCEVEVYTVPGGNLIEHINATTSLSSTISYNGFTWDSDKAIDGRMFGNPDTCQCCSGTKREQSPWWQIDLQHQYLIDRIEICGRMDGYHMEQYSNLTVYISNSTFDGTHVPRTIVGQMQNVPKIYTISLSPPRLFQNLIIRRTDQQYLVICEVRIYRTACGINTFGNGCSKTCHCKERNCTRTQTDDSMQCNMCAPGWNGQSCDTVCVEEHFGQNCSQTCSGNCKGGYSNCDQIDGNCTQGCIAGYKGVHCNTPCDDGKYGPNCTKNCGGCKNGQSCNKSNGSCVNGCEAGYHGTKCDPCANGTYGENCVHRCHCKVGDVCSKNNGSCPNGCDFGWSGPSCSIDSNLFSPGDVVFIANQSSIFLNNSKSFGPKNAIDNKEEYDIDHCQCCSVTNNKNTDPSWWQINLGQKYLIEAVQVFGRSKGNEDQLQHAKIYAGNESMINSTLDGRLIYTLPDMNANRKHFTKMLDTSIISQYFLVNLNNSVLVICEFKAFEKECDEGKFGVRCSHTCHCSDNKKCNAITGTCSTPGCFPGWNGTACDQECVFPSFGLDCKQTCHCINGKHCDHVTGKCDEGQCEAGWQTESCSQECSHGHFGKGCLSNCNCVNNSSCDHINGTCHAGSSEPGCQCDAFDAELKWKECITDTRIIVVSVVLGVIILLLVVYSGYITLNLRRANINKEQSRTSPDANKQPTYVNQEFENIAMSDNSVEDSDNTKGVYTSLNDETRAEKSTYEMI